MQPSDGILEALTRRSDPAYMKPTSVGHVRWAPAPCVTAAYLGTCSPVSQKLLGIGWTTSEVPDSVIGFPSHAEALGGGDAIACFTTWSCTG